MNSHQGVHTSDLERGSVQWLSMIICVLWNVFYHSYRITNLQIFFVIHKLPFLFDLVLYQESGQEVVFCSGFTYENMLIVVCSFCTGQ